MKKVLAVLGIVFAIGVTAQAARRSPLSLGIDLTDTLAATIGSFYSQAPLFSTLSEAASQELQEIQAKRAVDATSACTTYLLPDVGVSNGQHYWGVVDRYTPSSISCYILDNEPWDYWAVPAFPGEQITFAIETNVRTYFSIEHGAVFSGVSSLQPNGKYLTGYVWTVPLSFTSGYAEIAASPYALAATYTLAVAKPSGSIPPTATPGRGRETPTPGPPTPTPTHPAGSCTATGTTLCLNSSRFSVAVDWHTTDGRSGKGQGVSLTGDTGYFWFFSSNNVELVVKVVDGRAVNNSFWVFYGAMSDVEYTITINDTVTGRSKVYANPQGRMASVGDTAAFN